MTCCRILLCLLLLLPALATSANDENGHPLAGLPLREIGPALTSGRVADFAFHPHHRNVYYVAMASGGVWKTTNNGITWQAVFEKEGSFAVGVVELDPSNPDTVWVGTGENNSQRSVGYGDGVYKSVDGGRTWTNMGLKNSGHISMIHVDPEDSGHVMVAAQGPLWSSGGDRGLYRTRDGGANWERVLDIDADTGVNEFVVHPDRPESILASSYQRRRHVWTLINGGPGSGIHKSTDGGASWRKIQGNPKIKGSLPRGDLGRIGLAAAPSAPNVVYAIIEADDKAEGVYRSTDFGESWEKRSDHMTSSPQYYNELYVDPHNPDRVYSVDTFTNVSEDGGKSWSRLSFKYKHVDDHALWIDPAQTDHLFIGSDGGVFESWDRGQTWRHVRNLPATQFYRATPDNDFPFYNVCAGTQDNHTLCGPVRTTYSDGITNADWWISQFGDGFKTRFDPTDPNIVYSQYQYGGLARWDRVTGERVYIAPQPAAGENRYKWNWSSPLIVSPHNPSRLYYGSERLFRSEDRGDSWVAVSPDLSRRLDRNELEVMGRVWSVDAIAKNASTSIYGSLIALDESPVEEGLIYTGTDDGLIRVSTDGGANWSRIESFPDVPDQSLVEDIAASRHDADVAYAVFDNHKRGDYKPYVLKTGNRGRSWEVISGDLPERGSAHTIVEDHVDPDLLFVGTEFGVFFTQDGGDHWVELKTLPTVAVRDLEIQRREEDLVIGTFGRGVWILDDYSALRTPAAKLADGPVLFDIRDTWLFLPDPRRGWGGRGDFGSAKYAADNPPHGAVFTYLLPDGIQTLKEQRRETEKKRAESGGDNPYPAWEELRREDREEEPALVLTVRDADGNVVRRVTGPIKKGLHRVTWDLRHAAPEPVQLHPPSGLAPWQGAPQGPLAIPGTYTVDLTLRREGHLEATGQAKAFELKPLATSTLVAEDPAGLLEFQQQTAALQRAVTGANAATKEVQARIDHLVLAVEAMPVSSEAQAQAVRALNIRMQDLKVEMSGDTTVSSRFEPVPLSITARVQFLIFGHWNSRAGVPEGYRDSYAVADREFRSALASLKAIVSDLTDLEAELQAQGAPWTPGRIPDWP